MSRMLAITYNNKDYVESIVYSWVLRGIFLRKLIRF